MSSEPLGVSSVLPVPRDPFSIGTSNENTATLSPTDASASSNAPLASAKKRKSDDIVTSTTSTSLTAENLSDIKTLVDNIIKEMKDLRKCKLAIIHYEEFERGNTFPKDVDIDVKFGNPYPRSVSTHFTQSLDALAQQEKDIWNDAKRRITSLRLNVLKETAVLTERAVSEISNSQIVIDKVKNLEPTLNTVAIQTFENLRDVRVNDIVKVLADQDKAFQARQAKRLQRQQQTAVQMDIDDHTVSSSIGDDMASTLKMLREEMSSIKKDLANIKVSIKTPKNAKAPERKGRGNLVPQQKGKWPKPTPQPPRPNIQRTPPSHAALFAPPYYFPPPPLPQPMMVGPNVQYQQGQIDEGFKLVSYRKNRRPQNNSSQDLKINKSNKKGSATASGNRGKL